MTGDKKKETKLTAIICSTYSHSNGDNNISTAEFNDYKESTKKGLVDPNVDYARPLTISIILLGSILLFCFIPKLCQVSKVIIDKGGEKTKDWWIKRRSKK